MAALRSQDPHQPLFSPWDAMDQAVPSDSSGDQQSLPRHIAIIMDGNGRWAKARGLPRIEGHRRGAESVRVVVESCRKLGIPYLTLFCFSSENWKRPKNELDFLMRLLKRFVVGERPLMLQQQVRLRMLGRRQGLPEDVLKEVDKTLQMTQHHTALTLNLAINYGARGDLVDAVREIAQQVASGTMSPQSIEEQTIADHLCTNGLP
ncbi:MAG: polyprenyl diphosphate synthase, partial [Pirellulaceae bacterium]